MYDEIRNEFSRKHPEWSKATLHRMTNQMSAPPDDRCPPPHSTGGAVDLCLFDVETDTFLNMTAPFEWDETSAPTVLKGLTDIAQKNRTLLIETLEVVGLTNYRGEWWHWSYGDSGWALRVAAPFAVYDRLPEDEQE
jgi:D-alanyl-D-alanine dipeptidase